MKELSLSKQPRQVVCLDLEGVLIPEMWPFIAQKTGISELAITTREEPDYPSLVDRRITLLKKYKHSAKQVVQMMQLLEVLSDAVDFLDELNAGYEILIVSDAFKPMVNPFLAQLGQPNIECNHFLEDEEGFFSQPMYIRSNGKESTVGKLKASGFTVIAVGDALNDLGMLRTAHLGLLYKPSVHTKAAAPDIKSVNSYNEILMSLKSMR